MAMVKRSTFKTARVAQSAYNGETSLCRHCGRVVMPSQIKEVSVCPLCGENGLEMVKESSEEAEVLDK